MNTDMVHGTLSVTILCYQCYSYLDYFLDLNIYLVPIFVKIIQFGPYFRCLFNLVLIFVKSHSIESF